MSPVSLDHKGTGFAMLTRLVPMVFVAFLLARPAQAAALLDAPISFSATRTVTIDGKPYTGAMFHEPGRERDEQKLGAMEMAFILDGQSGQGFLVVPSVKTYVTFPFPPMLMALVDAQMEKQQPVGEEKIDKTPTTKYRVEKTTPDGSHGEGFVWISKRGVLMRLDGVVTSPSGHKTKIAMKLADVKEGPQKPELFAPPAGMNELPFQALAPLLQGIIIK
ncbi:MAG TPA: hypothetical protein VHX19_07235 [Stellaceae bacterium]|nr:hypothetical protein [Stellaceae bacterium]